MAHFLLGALLFEAAELVLLIVLGGQLGFWTTLLVIATTAVAGILAARAQGLSVFRRWLDALADRQQPEEGLADGLLVVAGGVLLVLPGFLGDVVGILLLIPPLRRVVAERLRRRAQGWVRSGGVEVFTMRSDPSFSSQDGFDDDRQPEIIDVEGVAVEPEVERPVVSTRPLALLPGPRDR